MQRYLFPKAPFEKADVQSFVAALEAELQEGETAGEDVDRLRFEQQESIDVYASTLSGEDATEFLLMCAAERLLLQKNPPTQHPARGKDRSADRVRGWMSFDLRSFNPGRALKNLDLHSLNPTRALKNLDLRSLNPTRALKNLDLHSLNPTRALKNVDLSAINPAVVGISIGVLLALLILFRIYLLFSS